MLMLIFTLIPVVFADLAELLGQHANFLLLKHLKHFHLFQKCSLPFLQVELLNDHIHLVLRVKSHKGL